MGTGVTKADGNLSAHDITVNFEGLSAIDKLDFELRDDEVLGLIGPNGAGKTTLVNVLTGFQRPTTGRVMLAGTDMTRAPPRRFAKAGIGRTFQNVRLFKGMTVLENLEVGSVSKGLSRRKARRLAHEILQWMNLTDKAPQLADSLSYGEERLLGIARGLTIRPRFLLLDEPAAGLNEAECQDLMHMIGRIPEAFSCGVMVIEHNMQVIMGVCQRIHVIASGRTIAEGTPQEVQADSAVIDAYLGAEEI